MKNLLITLILLSSANFGYTKQFSENYDDPKRFKKAKECILNGVVGCGDIDITLSEKDFVELYHQTGNEKILKTLLNVCENNKKQITQDWQSFGCSAAGRIFLKGRGIFGNGQGVEQDYQKALYYFKKSCELGNAVGCSRLADLYRFGYGTKINNQLAKQYHSKACDLGNQFSCNLLH